MKRTYTLFVLLGIVAGSLLTGCEKAPESTPPTTTTNAPAAPAAAPDAAPAASTNK